MQQAPFNNSILLSLFFQLLPLFRYQKYSPDTANVILEEYDYIVVGAGSGGATVAARLSEESSVKVLLLEAGQSPPALTEVPALSRMHIRTHIDWGYFTVPQKHTGAGLYNRQLYYPLGKVLGGSSTLNAMLYVRGDSQRYDEWEAGGATGWSYKDVLPYFKKSEMNRNPESVETFYHGFEGPMSVEKPVYKDKYKSAIKAAAEELGYDSVDVNGQHSNGFYDYQLNMKNGQRCSTAKAYLVPAENRNNLHIVKNAMVTKIIIENERAVGVRVDRYLSTREVKATREVIVSAGAINTPKLLMLSGIGPKEHLQEMNALQFTVSAQLSSHPFNLSDHIPVIADLPVGLNLQDHPASMRNYYTNSMPNVLVKMTDPRAVAEYSLNRTGILASSTGTHALMFGTNDRNTSRDAVPDYELYFLDGTRSFISFHTNIKEELLSAFVGPYDTRSQLWCISELLHPKSRGTVRLQSANIYDSPLIDPNYFEDPQDLKDILEGLKECDRMVNTSSLREIGVKPFETLVPGCEKYDGDKDAYFTCVIRTIVITIFHPVGTAKMGSAADPTTVVDPQLRVKGINSLRIVDASVMPLITNGNTNNPVIMIAEKAADMIKKDF